MENKKITFEELKTAAEAVVNLLREKGDPHMTVVVTGRSIKLVEDIAGTPMPYGNDGEDAFINFLMSQPFYKGEE